MKKALFKNGDTVEYIGPRKIWGEGKNILFEKGMTFSIIETRDPEKGLGKIGVDDEGEDIVIPDRDGHNVYVWSDGFRRIIWPWDKKEWRKL
jgi:hypothetical protein